MQSTCVVFDADISRFIGLLKDTERKSGRSIEIESYLGGYCRIKGHSKASEYELGITPGVGALHMHVKASSMHDSHQMIRNLKKYCCVYFSSSDRLAEKACWYAAQFSSAWRQELGGRYIPFGVPEVMDSERTSVFGDAGQLTAVDLQNAVTVLIYCCNPNNVMTALMEFKNPKDSERDIRVWQNASSKLEYKIFSGADIFSGASHSEVLCKVIPESDSLYGGRRHHGVMFYEERGIQFLKDELEYALQRFGGTVRYSNGHKLSIPGDMQSWDVPEIGMSEILEWFGPVALAQDESWDSAMERAMLRMHI